MPAIGKSGSCLKIEAVQFKMSGKLAVIFMVNTSPLIICSYIPVNIWLQSWQMLPLGTRLLIRDSQGPKTKEDNLLR